jgi:hypothetical protein
MKTYSLLNLQMIAIYLLGLLFQALNEFPEVRDRKYLKVVGACLTV